MVETNITRRRVMQGVGAAGVATMAGAPVIAAQEGEDGAVGEDATAIRVAHASPDTPSVQVFVEEAGTGATGAGDAGGNTTGGNETGGNETGGDDEDEPLFDGIGYSDVSNYEEVEPGTYQIRVVATEDVGLLGGLFEEGEERVVFEQEAELSEGTTYTAVAYGELSRANLEGTTPGADQDALGQDDNETAGVGAGDNETVGEDVGNETAGAGTNETTAGANETGAAADDDGAAGEGAAGEDATGTDGQGEDGGVLIDELAFGEHEYVELPADDHSLAFLETEATDEGVDAGADDGVGAGDNETVGQDAGNETVGQDDGNETVGGGTNETAGGAGDDEGGLGEQRDEKAFQVALLEDELSVTGTAGAGNETVGDDGDTVGAGNDTVGDGNDTVGGGNATGDGASGEEQGQSRVRIFHAVPDVDTLQVAALGGTDDGQGAGGEDGGADNVTVDDGAGNDTGGAGAGDDGGAGGDGAAGGDGGPGGAGGGGVAGGGEDSVQVTQVSTEDGTVYSGFAVGYFDPDSAGQADGGADGGNVTAGGGDNVTAGGDDNATAGEDDGEDDDITEDPEGRGFEFVTVEDAQDGERADGGTGGGLLSLTASAPSASD